jgi:opacity protein-like surface antigen
MKNKLFITLCLSLGLSTNAFAAADDNEIWLQQSGNALILDITQKGYANKVGGDDFSGTSIDMILTGATNTMTLLQYGDSNKLYGPFIADLSTVNLSFTGNSNSMDWNVGYQGSADSLNMLGVITGDSNTFDIDIGYDASAEYLNWDLSLTGSSNVFTTKIDSDNAKWDWTVTGSSNDINTIMADATDNSLTAVLTGSSNDIDIVQKSGSDTGCPVGSSCSGIIDVSFVTSNANIDIVQKDDND